MPKGFTVCTPTCRKFRCSRQHSALKIRNVQSQKMILCAETNDECDGAWCKFGVCTIRKMTDAGKCKGFQAVPAPSYDGLDLAEDFDQDVPSVYSKQLRGKRAFDRDRLN